MAVSFGGGFGGIGGTTRNKLLVPRNLGAGEQLRQAQQQVDLQTQLARAQQKKQNRLFDMLLGSEDGGPSPAAGGLIGDVFGNLVGDGGGGVPSQGTGVLPRPGLPGGLESPTLQQGATPGAGAYGAGQRAALDEDFRNALSNAMGSLTARGLGGSSLVGPTAAAVARQKQLAGGELEDRLFREQLQFRAAERAPLFGLLGQLLGGLGV